MSGAPATRLSGVTVYYDAGPPALCEVDLLVQRGERVALVGPSGAGKSTLLRLCAAAMLPTIGSVEVLGIDVGDAEPAVIRGLRRRIGTIHQSLDLVGSLRVVHNVNAGRLGSWSRRRALRSLVRPVGVDDVHEALGRLGVADKIDERTDQLSGGEQQRVAVARALIGGPDLIIADEPVSSLDPGRAADVMAILRATAESGSTLVASLHDFGLARATCDRLVGLRAGRVVFDLPAGVVTDELGADLYRITVAT